MDAEKKDAGEASAILGMKSSRSGKRRPISKRQTVTSVLLLIAQRINRILPRGAHGRVKGADAAADKSHQ